MFNNDILPIFFKDVYKTYHPLAYAPGVEFVYSNFTPRFGKHSNVPDSKGMIFLGLQLAMKTYLEAFNTNFFSLPTEQVINEYRRVTGGVLGKEIDTTHIKDLHQLGYLPIEIKAVKEGTLVPYGVAAYTIKNTVSGFGWVVNALETMLSSQLWSACTSATTARKYLQNFLDATEASGLDPNMVPFLGHDFSYRGLPGTEAAVLSGIGHLSSFLGSDTYPAGLAIEKFYGGNIGNGSVMVSVDATEHSVMTSYGKMGEKESLEHLITKVTPNGIISVVSDTWDFWKLVTEYLPELKEVIEAREGTLVIRPDSGDPVHILTGYKLGTTEFKEVEDFYAELDDALRIPEAVKVGGNYYEAHQDTDGRVALGRELTEYEVKGLIECLWDIFGGTVNDKGYKALAPCVGAIYGDSITLDRQEQIIARLMGKGFVPQVVLGIGSFTYQYVTRDTHGTAIKATHMVKNGKAEPMFKDPKTDSSKKSAKGLLRVEANEDGTLVMFDEQTEQQEAEGVLETVYLNGHITKETAWDEVRKTVLAQSI